MEITAVLKKYFTQNLMLWHRSENNRSLPWKVESDPYKIWLAEIIMQQTRVEQGTPYYERFVERYPNVTDLASAKDEDVFRLWQGLGYYNRCRNLLHTARFIAFEQKGEFPIVYEDVLKLKGIGEYTAAAIVSFAYNSPYAVVDGNVLRVLSRFFGIETPVDSSEGKKYFQKLAQELIDSDSPGEFNQAIMDFGAVVCKPALPLCQQCVLQQKCYAFKHGVVSLLPVKRKKAATKHRYFNYVIFTLHDEIWIRQRIQKDIWQFLYEPFLIESEMALDTDQVSEGVSKEIISGQLHFEGRSVQKLSHQTIHAEFFSMAVKTTKKTTESGGLWVSLHDLKNYAFPKTIVSFFQKKGYF